MKKVGMVGMLVLALVASMASAETKYDKVVVTNIAGTTSISLTNANTKATYKIVNVYFGLSAAATADSTFLLTDKVGTTNSVLVDYVTMATNVSAVGGSIDLADSVLQQDIGSVATITRPATATNSHWWVEFVIKQDD